MNSDRSGTGLRNRQKIKNTGIFALYAFVLGAAAGALVWLVVKVMDECIAFLWEKLPGMIGHQVIYTFALCMIGGLCIGLFRKKFGVLPDTLEEARARLKKDGTYPYDRLHIIAAAALMPLIFGGSLGPEAGLAGLIIGLCCWAGDRLKCKGAQARELAEAGMAATLGVVFNTPFFGFVNNYEHTREEEGRFFSIREFKAAKTVVYISGIAGGFLVMSVLRKFFGGGLGLPRFHELSRPGADDWKWFLVFAGAGILCGLIYLACNRLTCMIAGHLADHAILLCVSGGAVLALIGTLLPWTMFSGERQMGELAENWQEMSVMILIATAAGKIFIVNFCINFGWKGGNIFPLIFAGVSMGYAMAALTGAEPVFVLAVTAAAEYGYIIRKPLTVVAVLFLCFPPGLVLPLALASYIASFIPAPWIEKNEKSRRRFGNRSQKTDMQP